MNSTSRRTININATNTLVTDLQKKGFKVRFYAIEISCRGFISKENTDRLFAFCKAVPGLKLKSQELRQFKKSLCKIAITTSFIVFKTRFQPTWCKTPLITNL